MKNSRTLDGTIFEHNAERLPGISSGGETLPCNQNFEMVCSFTNVLDLVVGVPDAIGELRDFLHFCWSSNRSVGVWLDAAYMDDGDSVSKQVLNFDLKSDKMREMHEVRPN